jgi:hypothetical protein
VTLLTILLTLSLLVTILALKNGIDPIGVVFILLAIWAVPIGLYNASIVHKEKVSFYLAHQNADPKAGLVYNWEPGSQYSYGSTTQCLHEDLYLRNRSQENNQWTTTVVANSNSCKP